MPLITVTTNIPSASIPADFELKFVHLVAESLKKPIELTGVSLYPGVRLNHGGTTDPVAIITVESIGSLTPEDNVRHTEKITELCKESLHLPANKVAISFRHLAAEDAGFNGTTIAEQLKKK